MSVEENGISPEKGNHTRDFKQRGLRQEIDYTGGGVIFMKYWGFIGLPVISNFLLEKIW